jgi:hypothetical protein
MINKYIIIIFGWLTRNPIPVKFAHKKYEALTIWVGFWVLPG